MNEIVHGGRECVVCTNLKSWIVDEPVLSVCKAAAVQSLVLRG